MTPIWIKTLLSLVLLSLWTTGCGLPAHFVRIVPAPVRSFPPPEPSVVRLPVEIIFPSGGDIFQHISNFLKGGIKQFVPKLYNVPGLNVKPRISNLWDKMQEPIALDKGVWLLVRPQTLSVGVMEGDAKKLLTAHTVLEMIAQPEILFGPKPLTTKKALPPLSLFKSGPPTFEAVSNIRMSYKEVNLYLHDPRLGIIGKVIPGSGERKLRIKNIRLYGSGGKVIVEVKVEYNPPIINFSGKPAKMTIYLRGTPRYRSKKRIFDLPDLDFDVKSNDLLVQLANWIFNSDIKNELRKVARVPIGEKMDKMKARMEFVLNRPIGHFTRLITHVNSFNVLDGFADNEGIEMRVSLEGDAVMQVIWN